MNIQEFLPLWYLSTCVYLLLITDKWFTVPRYMTELFFSFLLNIFQYRPVKNSEIGTGGFKSHFNWVAEKETVTSLLRKSKFLEHKIH